MCSTDFGVLDLLFDKEDPTCKVLDGFKNTFFSTAELNSTDPSLDVKEEVLDSGTIDWKLSSDWDADELLRSVLNGHDMSCDTLNTPTLDSLTTLTTPDTLTPNDDMDSLEDLVGLPFHAVMDSGASDSGMSSDSSLDQQMSPASGYSVSSPESALGMLSPDHGQDTNSDISSINDFASTTNLYTSPTTPETLLAADDFLLPDSGFSSPVRQVVCEPVSVMTTTPSPAAFNSAPASVLTSAPAPGLVTRAVVNKASVSTGSSSNSSATVTNSGTPLLKTVTVGGPNNSVGGQTIVVTQANKNGQNTQLVRGPTILKSGQASRSILLPVTVKDLNQVRTIKIISTGGSGGVGVGGAGRSGGVGGGGVRTVVSTVRTPVTTSTTSLNNQSIRTALLNTVRGQESKSLLKGGTSSILTTGRCNTSTNTTTCTPTNSPAARVKVEPLDDEYDDDDEDSHQHTPNQQLTLSDEEKRLLKKEGILLPSHYPLTKQEERELKRIRRKIRNKISAQDSRKRKKEYIDGLEDRVKACTEENQQLQKRIRSLEAQNESLLNQMRRFQTSFTSGNSGRLQTHASTALMMLILSAALFIVPTVRQDTPSSDADISLPSNKMPSAGHSRSLLEAGNVGVPDSLSVLESVDDEVAMEVEIPLVEALGDHDYIPPPKKQRLAHKASPYIFPPLDDFPPQHGKPDSGGGFPPDDGSLDKISARIIDTMVDQVNNNYSDPGGKHNNAQAVVVNLGHGKKRLREDLELE